MRVEACWRRALTVFALAGISADSNWPQFAGPGRYPRQMIRVAETWSSTENMAGKRCAWRRVGLARRLGRSIFPDERVNTERNRPAGAESLYGGRSRATTAVLRWVVYDFDFKTGKLRWEREVARAVPPSEAHEES